MCVSLEDMNRLSEEEEELTSLRLSCLVFVIMIYGETHSTVEQLGRDGEKWGEMGRRGERWRRSGEKGEMERA